MRVHFIDVGGAETLNPAKALHKKRIVVAGSHGKTTTTAMIMHVFKYHGIKFDYKVGSMVDGFVTMVGYSEDAKIIAVLTGITVDHIKVFPTTGNYIEQFKIFIEKIPEEGSLIYFESDTEVKKLVLRSEVKFQKIPYKVHGYFQNKTGFYVATLNRTVQVKFFGEQNMQNLSAAKEACLGSGISEDDFYEAIISFGGASKQLY